MKTEIYMITKEEIDAAIQALKKLQLEDSDSEQNHIDADDILLDLLPHEIQEEYDKIGKWYA